METNAKVSRIAIRACAGTIVAALSFVVLAVHSGSAQGQKADRPDVKVGDQWHFSKSGDLRAPPRDFDWIVTSVTPEKITGKENGEPLLLTPDLNVLESPWRKDSNGRLLSFPLEVGKSWTFVTDYLLKDTGTTGQGEYSVLVLTHEKVRVPAGEFDAFKLEARGSFSGISRVGPVSGLSTITYWYAPAARAIVKQEIDDPYRGQYRYELVDSKLQP